jgi:hypothetical protein
VRRFAMLVLSLSMVLGLTGIHCLFAQDKKEEPKKEAPKVEAPKADTAKTEAPKAEEPPAPVPPEVQKKIDAAWRAIAEAVVAAEDAGLVKTSIKPAPVLDVLITGHATDEAAVKNRKGVSPEVFGAWFTGFGQTQGVNAQSDVRIVQPSMGLKAWYDKRAEILNREVEAVRKAKAPAQPKPEAEPKKDEPKKEQPKKDEAKKEQPKPAPAAAPAPAQPKDEPKKDEPKKDNKKDEPKKDDKKDEPKKDDKK